MKNLYNYIRLLARVLFFSPTFFSGWRQKGSAHCLEIIWRGHYYELQVLREWYTTKVVLYFKTTNWELTRYEMDLSDEFTIEEIKDIPLNRFLASAYWIAIETILYDYDTIQNRRPL